MHLNMLPIQYRRRQVLNLRLRQWSLVWGAALAMALALGWFQCSDCRRMSSDLELLEAKYNRVKDVQTRFETAQAELQELEQRESLVLELSQRRPMLSLLGILSRAARQCGGNVSVTHINWNADRHDAPADAQDELQPLLTLQGVGLSNLYVAQFVSALKDNEILCDVTLKSTEKQVINGKVAHGYHMECTVY
jgi:hypothetical protein